MEHQTGCLAGVTLEPGYAQGKDEIIDWLLWYNRTRLHSTLAYVSPMQFEQDWLANQPRQVNS